MCWMSRLDLEGDKADATEPRVSAERRTPGAHAFAAQPLRMDPLKVGDLIERLEVLLCDLRSSQQQQQQQH